MHKFKITKQRRNLNEPPSDYKCANYYIDTNFEITQELADRISLTDGVSSANFPNRYYVNFSVAMEFFDYNKVRRKIKKILEEHIKQLDAPTEEIKIEKTTKKMNKMRFINERS